MKKRLLKVLVLLWDFYLIYSMFLSAVVVLYLLQLSNLYNVSLTFLSLLLSICIEAITLYLLFYKISRKDIKRILVMILPSPTSKIHLISNIIFLIGIVGTFLLYKEGGIILLHENKVNRLYTSTKLHYLNYLRNFLVYYIPLGFYLLKISQKPLPRLWYFSSTVLSIMLIALNLRRGELLFPFLSIIYLELLISFNKQKIKQFFFKSVLLITTFIYLFSLFGNLRVEYVMAKVYKTSVSSFYGMEGFPTTFVWIYIYLTSPLENFRYMVEYQHIHKHSWGLLLLYPFWQIIFKINGENLSTFRNQLYPYLDRIAGLNVSSFMQDALIDFSYLGIYIYLFLYYFLIYISVKRASKNIFGLLCYLMALNIALWSLFVNSFSIGPFIIGFILFYLLSFSSAWGKKHDSN